MEVFRLVFSPIEVNTYILANPTGDCAIIDCGCYSANESKEFSLFIESNKLNPVLLINTHCHLDHVFGNKYILEKFRLGAYSSEADERNRKDAVQHAMLFGLTMEIPPVPAGFITDKQIITFGMTKLVALNVPGHSAGSLAFYSESDKCVFTGDALFAGSIGRTDLPGGNYETLINSITSRLFTLPKDTVVYPGHGNSTTIGHEMKSNPYFSK